MCVLVLHLRAITLGSADTAPLAAVKIPGIDEVSLLASNLVADEPEKKRARFSPEDEGSKGKDSMEDGASSDEDDEEGEEDGDDEDEAPPHTRWAEEVTSIRMIKGGAGAGVECEVGRFVPLYTHQVFYTPKNKLDTEAERENQELIIGYEDPELELVYAANTLKAYLEFRNSAKVDIKLLKQNNLTRTR